MQSEEEEKWRQNLEVGQEIDGLDTEHLWYNSMVLQVRPLGQGEGQEQEVLVGYRVYRDNGDKVDNVNGNNYFGWS